MEVYVYTDKGWVNQDEVLTSVTGNLKRNADCNLIKINDELTNKFKKEMPFVVIRRGYYQIQSVH